MSGRVNLLAAGLAALGVLSAGLASPAAAAEEGVPAGEDRWEPSLAVISGVTFQLQSAAVSSFDATGMPFRPSNSDDEWAVSPYVGGNLQLLTPSLPLPGRPRLFFTGEVLPSFGRDRQTAKEGDPGTLQRPVSGSFPETTIRGQGSATTSTLDTWVFGAGMGLAFPFEFMGRRLWAKPSVGWIRYKMDVSGELVSAQCTPYPGPPPQQISTECGPIFPNPTQFPPNLGFVGYERDILFSSQASQYFNGIGPGLELEMSAGRFGPIGTTLFLDAHAYNIFGDRSIAFSNAMAYPRSPNGTGSAPLAVVNGQLIPNPNLPGTLAPTAVTTNWSFEVSPWMYRAGVGIRFRWVGFD